MIYIGGKTTFEKNYLKDVIFISISVKCISCRIKGFKKSVTYLQTDLQTYRQT